ncbi:unnamed protein product [Pedinophyceae sp. YPF-701]|nr:unnamed protein product [Pedinophyceae sp. YPF-701]
MDVYVEPVDPSARVAPLVERFFDLCQTIDGLDRGQLYRIYVVASNCAGAGAASGSIEVTTLGNGGGQPGCPGYLGGFCSASAASAGFSFQASSSFESSFAASFNFTASSSASSSVVATAAGANSAFGGFYVNQCGWLCGGFYQGSAQVASTQTVSMTSYSTATYSGVAYVPSILTCGVCGVAAASSSTSVAVQASSVLQISAVPFVPLRPAAFSLLLAQTQVAAQQVASSQLLASNFNTIVCASGVQTTEVANSLVSTVSTVTIQEPVVTTVAVGACGQCYYAAVTPRTVVKTVSVQISQPPPTTQCTTCVAAASVSEPAESATLSVTSWEACFDGVDAATLCVADRCTAGGISASVGFVQQAVQAVLVRCPRLRADFVRAALLDSLTYRAAAGSGGANGSIRLAEERDGLGLTTIVSVLGRVQGMLDTQGLSLSFADACQVAAAHTVALFDGPRVQISLGRVDVEVADDFSSLVMLPSWSGSQVQSYFEQSVGMSSTQSWVSLLGAQTLGGFSSPDSISFSNSWFANAAFASDYAFSSTIETTATPYAGQLVLPSTLLAFEGTRPSVETFASSSVEFSSSFESAFSAASCLCASCC